MISVAALNRSGRIAHRTRVLRLGALLVGAAASVAACSQPVAGYREDPGACTVVSDRSIAQQLGPEAVVGPNTAKVSHTDSQSSSKCEWESFHPPGWGSPANAKIIVLVRLKLTEDGAPDMAAAQSSYRTENEDSTADAPPDVIGEFSKHKFEPGKPGDHQVTEIDFRRANAHVTVTYQGWGDKAMRDYFIPRDVQKAAARDFARQALAALGEPQR